MSNVRKYVVLFVVASLITGCSGTEPRNHRGAPTQPAPEFVNGGPCTSANSDVLPPNAGCLTTASGADGTLSVYAAVGSDSRPQRWRIRFEAADLTVDRRLDAGNPFSYPRALGAIDVDRDGTEEWVIKAVDLASHGTNWQRLELFVVQDADLVPVTFEDEILFVNAGGTSRMGEGATCEEGRLVLLRAEAQNVRNTIWRYSEREIEITAAEAELVTRREGTLRISDYNDPDLDPYFRVECGTFLYP